MSLQLPYFPSTRPDGMSIEEYKQARTEFNRMMKAHKKFGYTSGLGKGTAYNVIRQAKKYEQNGWSEKIPNQTAYIDLVNKLIEAANETEERG